MIIESQSILPGREIPVEHTADDKNLSPHLAWDDVPDGTVTFAVICEDPDAPRGLFTHWVIYDIPGEVRALRAGLKVAGRLENGACQGTNDFGRLGWGGPKPPRGDEPHTYHIRLYALDTRHGLEPGASRRQLLDAMAGHVLDEVDLPATFARPALA